MKQVQIVLQTIDDYRADRWLWTRQGRLVHGQDPGDRIYSVTHAQIADDQPIVDIVVVDLGPARLVTVTALENGDIDAFAYVPPAVYPALPLDGSELL